MRIAFDIDETLIPYGDEFPVECSLPSPLLAPFFQERLRYGTISLLRELARMGCEIWIYTTSGRSSAYLRTWLGLWGIRVGGVVNCDRHRRVVLDSSGRYPNCSKYPPAFGIDLLVDNSEGVAIEGQRYGFDVLVVQTDDPDWSKKVLEAVRQRGPMQDVVPAK